jgi:hypothetical protein
MQKLSKGALKVSFISLVPKIFNNLIMRNPLRHSYHHQEKPYWHALALKGCSCAVLQHLSPCVPHCDPWAEVPHLAQPRPVIVWFPCVWTSQEITKGLRIWVRRRHQSNDGAVFDLALHKVHSRGNPLAGAPMGWKCELF